MDTITEVNCETGEVLVRELTEAEIAQRKIDADQAKAHTAALAQAATDKAALLAKLGITADEAKLLLS